MIKHTKRSDALPNLYPRLKLLKHFFDYQNSNSDTGENYLHLMFPDNGKKKK